MALKLNQYVYTEGGEHGLITPDEDALFNHHVLRSNHMIKPVTASGLGGNQLRVSDGVGVVYGRQFEITEETLSIPTVANGSKQGRTVIKIDIANTDVPIGWEHQSGASLPALTQENLLAGGTVFEVPVASYTVTETGILNVNSLSFQGENILYAEKYDPNGRILAAGSILQAVYPVGSIYLSMNTANPSSLFGFGTWAQIAGGRMLVGVGAEDADYVGANKTGGSKFLQEHSHAGPSHTHTVGAHDHGMNSHTHTGPSHTHGVSINTNNTGSHTHSYSSGGQIFVYGGVNDAASHNVLNRSLTTGGAGAHAHSVSGNTGAGGTGKTGGPSTTSTANSSDFETAAGGTGNTGAAGTGSAQNMPPYLTCHIWQRTA